MKRMVLVACLALAACEEKPKEQELELVEPKVSESLETFGISATTKDMFKRQGVARLQQRLNAKLPGVATKLEEGLPDAGGSAPKNTPPDELELNGTLDEKTQRALGAFQKTEGLPETGMPDYETLARLGFEPSDVFHHRPPANRNKRDENRKEAQ